MTITRLRTRVGGLLPTPSLLIYRLIRQLIPRTDRESLQRFGTNGDGGYVLPRESIHGLECLFSPGVANTWSFEEQVATATGCRVCLIDGSIDRPGDLPGSFDFEPLWLTDFDSQSSVTLGTWISKQGFERSNRLGLQMDIEGGEWTVLRQASSEDLQRFQFLVVEFHQLDLITTLWHYLRRIRPVLRKVLRDFQVVHVHPNNCCSAILVGKILIPTVLEVSFVRRDLISHTASQVAWALDLDRDNVPEKPPIVIDSWVSLVR